MFRFTVGAQSKPICVSGIREVPDSRPIGALIGHLSLGAWGTKRAKRLPTSSANIRTLKVVELQRRVGGLWYRPLFVLRAARFEKAAQFQSVPFCTDSFQ